MSDASAPMQLTLLGAGQLGGSLALALKEAQNDIVITAYDPITQHSEILQSRGAVDKVAASPAEAVAYADIVVLAAPLRTYRRLITEIAHFLKPGTIVTDLGSVKRSMVQLQSLLPVNPVIAAHPIAGSEKSGPEVARSDLFKGRLCVLTPEPDSDTDALAIVETLWHATGADVIHMPAAVHDQIYAHVSHLPHFIAFVAASYFHQLGITLSPDEKMLQQFLRISRSNPQMWSDVALENREALLPVLGTYIALLEHFATELRAGEPAKEEVSRTAIAKSFLPRILAASLISSVSLYEQQSEMNLRPFGAGGMRDIVAPAAETPEADMEAISQAAPILADHIDAIILRFREVERLIGAEEAEMLLDHVTSMIDEAHLLVTPRN